MDIRIIKFLFNTMVHFGEDRLESAAMTFHADTLFSALYIEAQKMGAEDRLYEMAESGKLLLSDAFPFAGDVLYLPKPVKQLDVLRGEGGYELIKSYKKLKYIPCSEMKKYLAGNFDVSSANACKQGEFYMKVQASIRGEEETLPYRVNCFSFKEDCGLYVIIACEGKDEEELISSLVASLSYTGIGGKRSSGMGKFDYLIEDAEEDLVSMLEAQSEEYMALSVSLPADEELEDVLKGASYNLCRRSGFVASENFADEFIRKEDRYMFDAGSCFRKKYVGEIADVSGGRGTHPVYRYGKGLFVGI